MTYPPHGGFGYPPPAPDPATVAMAGVQQRNRRRMTFLLTAIVAVLALVLALLANQVFFNKTGKSLIPGLTLRAANDPGPDPFTTPVTLVNRTQAQPVQVSSAPGMGVQQVNGTEPGFYGTYGTAACDTASLGNQLAASPAAAHAWASVQGIRPSDIPWYLNSLTPVVLTADTWVTNHSFRGGQAHPFQAVLQAGTAVYVDAAGVPRAVCSCGNPLRPPASAPIGGYRAYGTPWPGYRAETTYRVAYNNTYVTNNTTVQQAPPQQAAANGFPTLQVTDLLAAIPALTSLVLDGTLDDLPAPPAGTPAFGTVAFATAANGAPAFPGTAAEENGLSEDSTEPNAAVLERNVQTDGDPLAVVPGDADDSATAESSGDESSAAANSASESSAAADSPTGTQSSAASSASLAPTQFLGSGDAVSELSYTAAGGREVTCELPAAFDSAVVVPTNSDCATLRFNRDDLLKSAIDRTVGASSDRVWRITPVDATEPIVVTTAQWQTLAATSTTTEPSTTESTTTPTTETSVPSSTTATTEPSTSTAEVPGETTGAVPSA
ncbi:MAG: DUF6777 domain-containing protein [Gordonia sp. (in: high G+C Gram-positive bacteria)]|uniref:DUF6777 domain-containing protein n=1 Tax=Gordonia sp. (in: high G+C Gram-positive bacteria) TaxID=84139 RepID=UPI003BB55A0A